MRKIGIQIGKKILGFRNMQEKLENEITFCQRNLGQNWTKKFIELVI